MERRLKELSNTARKKVQAKRAFTFAHCWISFAREIFSEISSVKIQRALEPSRTDHQLH
jgi:hypothetical protein